VAFEEYQKSWEPVYPVEFEYIRSEMNTQFANIATPSEVVVVTTFNIELGAGGGDFHICMPYAMIEPIRDLLYSTMQGERLEVDDRWARRLTKQVQVAEVDMVVNLGHASVTLGQIVNMKAGDVISLDIPEAVVAEVDGVPVLECKYGVLNGQYALKVNKILAGLSDDSPPQGKDEHA
jgi:flagellar motor switch protein FliM